MTQPMANKSDSQTWQAFELLMNEIALKLRNVKGVVAEEAQIVREYFRKGYELGQSLPALIDFLGISSRSVLDKAGYSDDDSQRVMDSLADITDFPNPPDAI